MFTNELLINAAKFIHQAYSELDLSLEKQKKRMNEIEEEIRRTGTYQHTSFEIEHGAKMAWRNSNRCIGRLLWHTLHVFDYRHITDEQDIFNHLLEHINFATNKGKIRSTITVFAPRNVNKEDPVRVWNHQLIRYAGYKIDGEIIGDSMSVEFTKICHDLGWKGEGTPYDILPLVIQKGNACPKLFEIPAHMVKEVKITHPTLTEFKNLNLKWYAVPIISNMKLEIGGIDYPLAPFNGWYMGTEIGARNFADIDRYNQLENVAHIMKLDTSSTRSLWKDKALVELNVAVLHAYEKAGVTLVDHHTAAEQFKRFELNEKKEQRKITGNWTWLIPPVSPATTHIFHRGFNNSIVSPNYFYQKNPY